MVKNMDLFGFIDLDRRNAINKAGSNGYQDGINGVPRRPFDLFQGRLDLFDFVDEHRRSEKASHYDMMYELGTRMATVFKTIDPNGGKYQQIKLIEQMISAMVKCGNSMMDNSDEFVEKMKRGNDVFYEGEASYINNEGKKIISKTDEIVESVKKSVRKLTNTAEFIAELRDTLED